MSGVLDPCYHKWLVFSSQVLDRLGCRVLFASRLASSVSSSLLRRGLWLCVKRLGSCCGLSVSLLLTIHPSLLGLATPQHRQDGFRRAAPEGHEGVEVSGFGWELALQAYPSLHTRPFRPWDSTGRTVPPHQPGVWQTNTSRLGTTSLESLRLSGFLSRSWAMIRSSSR